MRTNKGREEHGFSCKKLSLHTNQGKEKGNIGEKRREKLCIRNIVSIFGIYITWKHRNCLVVSLVGSTLMYPPPHPTKKILVAKPTCNCGMDIWFRSG